jgi:hypothetical protein
MVMSLLKAPAFVDIHEVVASGNLCLFSRVGLILLESLLMPTALAGVVDNQHSPRDRGVATKRPTAVVRNAIDSANNLA